MKVSLVCSSLILIPLLGWMALMAEPNPEPTPKTSKVSTPSKTATNQDARKLYNEGNYKEAFEIYSQKLTDPKTNSAEVVMHLSEALYCLQRLSRVEEQSDFLEDVLEGHAKEWQVRNAIANAYFSQIQHSGYQIAGEFIRGPHRGGGKAMNSYRRDRARALQIFHGTFDLLEKESDKNLVGNFWIQFSHVIKGNYSNWEMQKFTDLAELPDYDEGWSPQIPQLEGAPVDEEGKVIYHQLPESWEAAQTDGERWRFVLQQAAKSGEYYESHSSYLLAQFYYQILGVQTLQGRLPSYHPDEDGKDAKSGIFALPTLKDNETIARLATGIKRITLPDDCNYLRIFQGIADAQTAFASQSLSTLGQIYLNRQQYPKAAEAFGTYYERHGRPDWAKQKIDQIIKPWGRFEVTPSQEAETAGLLQYRFRNGKNVKLTAKEINVEGLLKRVKAYLQDNPKQLDWQKININNIGYMITSDNSGELIGKEVASWNEKLEPLEEHFDRRIELKTPMKKAGAYWITAEMEDGNTSNVILWLNDLAIVKKPLQNRMYYFISDATNGKPFAGADLELFGYRVDYNGTRRPNVLTRQRQLRADFNGQVFQQVTNGQDNDANYQWIITAKSEGGKFGYLGFTGVWTNNYYRPQYNQVKYFTMTDRPVYRPDQTVQYKSWVRRAAYDHEGRSDFAGQGFTVEIYDPQNQKVKTEGVTADEWGGFSGSYELPIDATLGQYRIHISGYGSTNFRVEEYKKPEYEVSIKAPSKPVALGEKIEATISANYYFGSPVQNAKVKYKVLRTTYDQRWYPPAPYDWLYGPGYWWYSENYLWYPGWSRWGCFAPTPWWYTSRPDPPEVIAEQEVEIGSDGTVAVQIDTKVAQAIHPDHDHRYEIVAEVTDLSRRTIVGQGQVLVAREPYKIWMWLNRGYYSVGDTIEANMAARTLDQSPVEGSGELTLYSITYDNQGKPTESKQRVWEVKTNPEGKIVQQLSASEPGQYRLVCTLTDSEGRKQEGGYLFTVRGDGFDGSEFRFNDLELIPQQQDYAPGDTLKLQVNTDKEGATILLFTRPENSVYLKPQILHMKGKSRVVEIPISKADMPNFFVEAVTIFGGEMHQTTREIIVPPEKRTLDITVTPSQKDYLPGQEALFDLQLVDDTGEPTAASGVMTVYDKSVEYIAGGSNVPEIRSHFWKWRRQHSSNTETNLGRYFANMVLPNHVAMQNLGVFGEMVADRSDAVDELSSNLSTNASGVGASRRMRGNFGGNQMMMKSARAESFAVSAAPMAMEGAAMEMDMAEELADGVPAEGQAAPEFAEATVRSNFADTAYWNQAITFDRTGKSQVAFNLPEDLTSWKVLVWGMGHGTQVGQASLEVVTRKNLLVRMQAPRFFMERDEVWLSANVHNYLGNQKAAEVRLELDGKTLEPLDDLVRNIEIPAGGEVRVDWRVKVVQEGEAVLRMLALTDEESDAVERSFPVKVHGFLKTESISGAIRPNEEQGQFALTIPAERREEQTRLEVRYSPTLAGAMVDALPYLIDYPYGCTEQTLNRFLPAVLTQKALIQSGLDLAALKKQHTNLNAQELGDSKERAAQWKRFEDNPVFDQKELDIIVKTGVNRLLEMQLSDGGWGWFYGSGEHSDAHLTALVVRGLRVAQQNDVAIDSNAIQRGLNWLEAYEKQQVQLLENAATETKPYRTSAHDLDAFVHRVLVEADKGMPKMRDFLYRDRLKMSSYGLALIGMAFEQVQEDRLEMIMRNLSQYLVEDDENQTAYLKLPNSYWWVWYGDEIETQAAFLQLLIRNNPEDPRAPKLVKYLLNNRKHATYWRSTRDTALVVEAFFEYLQATGENQPEMVVEIWVNGQKSKEVEIRPDNLFTFDNQLVLTGKELSSGPLQVEIRKRGTGPLYYNAYLTNFTLEEGIKATGLEIKVNRKYYLLKEKEKEATVSGSRGQAVQQRVEAYDRVPLEDYSTLQSGDLVEVELVIESKNDYEYLLFEDMKAAGFEPVQVRSGYVYESLRAYVEFRDDRVSFFVKNLARGKHSVSYRLRAEIPGTFHALPTKGEGMYAPELVANSDEIILAIEDQE
ncbi:Alpha-2-macroglobulin [Planctomycetales bacterium 10988]|nr:Alpha-2-macroglobulin [Planctomycetales bacterium 10988]